MTLPTDDGSDAARLDAIESFVLSVDEGVEQGLARLGPLTEPSRVQSAMRLLIENHRFSDAIACVRPGDVDCKWADLLVYAHAALGQADYGRDVIRRVNERCDSATVMRCRLAFGEAALSQFLNVDLWTGWSEIAELNEQQRAIVESVIAVLAPIVQLIRLNQSIESEPQATAIAYSARAHEMLGQLFQISDLVAPLERSRPVPLLLAHLALRNVYAPREELAGRLRVEHPTSFHAQVLAALVERDLLDRPRAALDALLRLDSWALREGAAQVETLCLLLFETASGINARALGEARAVVNRLKTPNNDLNLFFDAMDSLLVQKPDDGLKVLNENPRLDDVVWLQLVARCHEHAGHATEAAESWSRACKLMPNASMLTTLAGLNVQQQQFAEAVVALEKARQQSPDSLQILRRLGSAYVTMRRFADAARVFEALLNREPVVIEHRLNWAISLARSSQAEKALTVLDAGSDAPTSNHRVTLVRCQILNGIGRASEALKELRGVKEKLGNDRDFLALLMTTAYRAGDDRLAEEAFARLVKLEEGSPPEQRFLRPGSLEDLIEFGKQRRRARESLTREVILGKVPWLFAEALFGIPALRAWQVRTQPVTWVPDEPNLRAELEIYSTNGLRVANDRNGHSTLQPIEAPPKGTEIVADLSALITLFQLKRLDVVKQYFGRVILPSTYSDLNASDTGRLSSPQVTREIGLKRIRDAIDTGRISVISHEASDPATTQRLDEYSDSSSNAVFHFVDLHSALGKSQRLNGIELSQLERVLQERQLDPAEIVLTRPLLIQLESLRTLADFEWFEKLLDSVTCVITSEDQIELTADIHAFARREEALQWHQEFWRQLAEVGYAREVASSNSLVAFHSKSDPESQSLPHFDAPLLAVDLGKPLLADDRVAQAYVIGRDAKTSFAAFGTDTLLAQLARDGLLAEYEYAQDILKMMHWRYRFLIPEPKVLKVLADISKANLPGPDLRSIAAYVQDSMRAPGLFCGLEATDPPLPMALQLHMRWTDVCGSFLALVWSDSSYREEQLESLTRWCIRHLVPMVPPGLLCSPPGRRLTAQTPFTFVLFAMMQFVVIQPVERANQALRIVADEFGMTNGEFLATAAEAADDKYDRS